MKTRNLFRYLVLLIFSFCLFCPQQVYAVSKGFIGGVSIDIGSIKKAGRSEKSLLERLNIFSKKSSTKVAKPTRDVFAPVLKPRIFTKNPPSSENTYINISDGADFWNGVQTSQTLVMTEDIILDRDLTLKDNTLVGAKSGGKARLTLKEGAILTIEGGSFENMIVECEGSCGLRTMGPKPVMFVNNIVQDLGGGKPTAEKILDAIETKLAHAEDVTGEIWEDQPQCFVAAAPGLYERNTFRRNPIGICTGGTSGILIVGNTFEVNGVGITVEGGQVTIRENLVKDSVRNRGPSDIAGYGIIVRPPSAHVTIVGNEIIGNERGGIGLTGYAQSEARIEDNYIKGSAQVGIGVEPGNWAAIWNNDICGNGIGMYYFISDFEPRGGYPDNIENYRMSVSVRENRLECENERGYLFGNEVGVLVSGIGLLDFETWGLHFTPGFNFSPEPVDWERPRVKNANGGTVEYGGRYFEFRGPNEFRGSNICGFVNATGGPLSVWGNYWDHSPPLVARAVFNHEERRIVSCAGDIADTEGSTTYFQRPQYLVDFGLLLPEMRLRLHDEPLEGVDFRRSDSEKQK